jgi:hypothetical protein
MPEHPSTSVVSKILVVIHTNNTVMYPDNDFVELLELPKTIPMDCKFFSVLLIKHPVNFFFTQFFVFTQFYVLNKLPNY